MVVAVAAGNLGHGVVLSHKERQRLLACATRVRRIADQVDADARRRARRILPPARGRSRAQPQDCWPASLRLVLARREEREERGWVGLACCGLEGGTPFSPSYGPAFGGLALRPDIVLALVLVCIHFPLRVAFLLEVVRIRPAVPDLGLASSRRGFPGLVAIGRAHTGIRLSMCPIRAPRSRTALGRRRAYRFDWVKIAQMPRPCVSCSLPLTCAPSLQSAARTTNAGTPAFVRGAWYYCRSSSTSAGVRRVVVEIKPLRERKIDAPGTVVRGQIVEADVLHVIGTDSGERTAPITAHAGSHLFLLGHCFSLSGLRDHPRTGRERGSTRVDREPSF